MSWYLLAWQRATEFSGRSRRKEYWYFQLFNGIVMIFIALFAIAFSDQGKPAPIPFGLMAVYGLVVFIPSLAVTVRRLHDTGRSGWWYFIAFVPLIGGLILFIFTLLDSDPDRNEYGPNPKVPGHASVII